MRALRPPLIGVNSALLCMWGWGLSLAAATRPQVQNTHTCTLQRVLNTRGGAKLFNLSKDTSAPRLLVGGGGERQPLLLQLDYRQSLSVL